MTKTEFLYELREGLSDFPEEDINEYIDFYSEMIDDRMEEGLSEEAAVADIGSVQEVIDKIISETPLPTLIKTKLKKEHTLKVWQIVLIALGSPIWCSLLIAVISVIFSVIASIFAVIISLYAAAASFVACGVGGVFATVPMFIVQNPLSAFAALGMGLFSIGCGILMFFGCNAITKLCAKLTKKFILWIKSLFIRKENAK